MAEKLPPLLALVITVAWMVSFTVDIISPTYDPPASVHALMMAVAGFVFGGTVLKSARNGGK